MKKASNKTKKKFETRILGFKIRLLDVPIIEIDGEEIVDIDFELLAEQIFFDLLRTPVRLTGNQLRFMRKHLGLRQEDMKALLGIEQGNVSRLEAKGDKLAFDNDIDLIALKAGFAKFKLEKLQLKNRPVLSDFIHAASEFRNPTHTFVRRIA